METSNETKSIGGKTSSDYEPFVVDFLIFTVTFLVILKYFNELKSNKFQSVFGSWRTNGNYKKEYLEFNDLPAVTPSVPFKLIGNLPQFFPLSELGKTAEGWSNNYGDICTFNGLNQQFVLLNSGPTLQALLKSADLGHVIKTPVIYDQMKPLITNGVLVSKGPFWQKQRKILMKSQSFQNLKGYNEMLNRNSKNLVEDLAKLFQDEQPHQVNDLINISFLGIINEMITGNRLVESDELTQYHHNFNIWKECVVNRILNPLLLLPPIWYFHPLSKMHSRAVNEMSNFAKRRLEEHKKIQVSSNQNNELDLSEDSTAICSKYSSLLDELLNAGVDDAGVIDEFNTMMFGGHETGAGTIHFLWFSLALDQMIQEQARKEVDELFDNPNYFKNGQITNEAANSNLKYVERCILETLRLFPAVFLVSRKLESPLKFEYQGKNVLLSSGTNIIISPYATHRREELYPNYSKFDPDRFLPENVASRHAYTYIPFLAGPRNCLGLKFAMIEMKIITAWILRNFEITTTDKMEDITLLPHTTLTPSRDYTFHFKRRSVSNII